MILVLFLSLACARETKEDVKPSNSVPRTQPSPAATVSTPKDGNYNGKGQVTKIDMKLGSVGLDHENIEGLMPAMQMEFYVKDKAMIKDLKVGDKVDFIIEYKGGTETITAISKLK